MKHADPVAQAEIDRLEAALAAVREVLEENRRRNLRNDVSLGYRVKFTAGDDVWIREDAILRALDLGKVGQENRGAW